MKKRKRINKWLWIPTILAFFSSLVQVFFVLVTSTEYWGVHPFQYIGLIISLILIVCIWIVKGKLCYVVCGIIFFCIGLGFRHLVSDLKIIYYPLLWAGITLLVITWFENKQDSENPGKENR